jgi:imidazole glycerol-phosphate synthase subunit HisH
MPQIQIIDYGVGNLLSLKFAFEKAGLKTNIAAPTVSMKEADAIALPGVGNFSAAARALQPVKADLADAVSGGKPILGICLGMQLYFESSEEGPGKGLGLFKGRNVRLTGNVKVPHMGWNTLRKIKDCELFSDVDDDSFVYFVHSLYPVPDDKEVICTQTEYAQIFTSAVASKNILGTQFHPEKSGEIGMQILRNFAKIVAR